MLDGHPDHRWPVLDDQREEPRTDRHGVEEHEVGLAFPNQCREELEFRLTHVQNVLRTQEDRLGQVDRKLIADEQPEDQGVRN